MSNDKKIFSINGPKGCGKTSVLKAVIKNLQSHKFQWCIGKCTQLTQLTPGGVIQDMLLNLFRLPNYCVNNEELKRNATDFFSKEFHFLNKSEIEEFFNFIYNYIDGNYEDIIINKKRTYGILNKIFDAFTATGRFIYVIDNFDFIDGFSAEFLTNFIQREQNRKNLKFIALYNEYRPISAFFEFDNRNKKAYLDIGLENLNEHDIRQVLSKNTLISDREKELIINKCDGNLAYVEQASSYAFDCQISDRAFILPEKFADLVKVRLETLKKTNPQAHKVLCGAAILGNKINLNLMREIFDENFEDIVSYLVKSHFIRAYDDISYEFNNLMLWETILKSITHDSVFDDINIKIGKVISVFNLNTNATMAMIAHNL